jgi:hypothetical protein
MSKFYLVHTVVRYNPIPQRLSTRTNEILPGVWEEAVLVDRLGRERLDELARYPAIVEAIEPSSR